MEPHKQLADWLESANVSQAELARRCKYDPSNMHKIVKGKLTPTLEMAFAIDRETAGAVPASAWVRAAA